MKTSERHTEEMFFPKLAADVIIDKLALGADWLQVERESQKAVSHHRLEQNSRLQPCRRSKCTFLSLLINHKTLS